MAYTTLDASYSSPLTLTTGTYYISADVDMTNIDLTKRKIVFDLSNGDIVLKRNGDVSFNNVHEIDTIPSGTNQIYYTVKDDDTIGETIIDSSGSPSAIGGQLADNIIAGFVDLRYMEIRWGSTQFIKFSSTPGHYLGYLTFKNCSYSLVTDNYVIMNTGYSTVTQLHNFTFKSTDGNSLTGATGFLSFNCRTSVHDIIITGANTTISTGIITETLYGGSTLQRYNIKIINSNVGYGYRTGDVRRLTFNTAGDFLNCHCNIAVYTGDRGYFTVKNCLFDGSVSTIGGFGTNTTGARAYWWLKAYNCVFDNCINAIYDKATHISHTFVAYADDCIFTNNYRTCYRYFGNILLNIHTANNCGFYNNTFNQVLNNFNPINANPQFINAQYGCTIKHVFPLPDGYFVGNIVDYEQRGSNTFDALLIDETQYTATGKEYEGTDYITPGINYQVEEFHSPNNKMSIDVNLPKIEMNVECNQEQHLNVDVVLPMIETNVECNQEQQLSLDVTLPYIEINVECSQVDNVTLDVTLPNIAFEVDLNQDNNLNIDVVLPKIQVDILTWVEQQGEQLITKIIKQVCLLIESISVANGYNLNFGPCNIEDRTLTTGFDAYAIVTWTLEENNDYEGIVQSSTNKLKLNINLRVPLLTEETNPNFAIRSQLYKGLDDIKMLFGRNQNLQLNI